MSVGSLLAVLFISHSQWILRGPCLPKYYCFSGFLENLSLVSGFGFLALCAVFSAMLPLFHMTGSWQFFSLKRLLLQIQFPNYLMEKKQDLWPLFYYLYFGWKNKDMVTERTPLRNKSRQTNETCLVYTRKLCPGHAASWLLVNLLQSPVCRVSTTEQWVKYQCVIHIILILQAKQHCTS